MTKPRPLTQADRERLDKWHEDGAREFGGLWLLANQSVVASLQFCGLTPEHYRMLGARIATSLCLWDQRAKQLTREHTDATGRIL